MGEFGTDYSGGRTRRPPMAFPQGVDQGDQIDARGQIIAWEDDYTALVSFADGLRGFKVVAVPIATLTFVSADRAGQEDRRPTSHAEGDRGA